MQVGTPLPRSMFSDGACMKAVKPCKQSRDTATLLSRQPDNGQVRIGEESLYTNILLVVC